jgi:hypothetical protein
MKTSEWPDQPDCRATAMAWQAFLDNRWIGRKARIGVTPEVVDLPQERLFHQNH